MTRILDMNDFEVAKHGYHCAHCGSFVKLYHRGITGRMARALVVASRQGTDWFHWPTIQRRHSLGEKHFGMLAYWGLVEPKPGDRGDGSHANGWWRVTPLGHRFARGETSVPKKMKVLQGKVLGEVDGERVFLRNVADKLFSYEELMA